MYPKLALKPLNILKTFNYLSRTCAGLCYNTVVEVRGPTFKSFQFSFHQEEPGDQRQALGLGARHLCPLSHLSGSGLELLIFTPLLPKDYRSGHYRLAVLPILNNRRGLPWNDEKTGCEGLDLKWPRKVHMLKSWSSPGGTSERRRQHHESEQTGC